MGINFHSAFQLLLVKNYQAGIFSSHKQKTYRIKPFTNLSTKSENNYLLLT